jgi:hypothetical protein
MKKLLWYNSPTSGMCDRLLDTHLLAALASRLDYKLYLEWKDIPEPNSFQKNTWPISRYSDYRVENFTKYFNLSKIINFIDNKNIIVSDKDDVIFTEYLGGVYSPNTFYNKYVKSICSFEDFDQSFKSILKDFTPKELLLDTIGTVPEIDIAVHLRRGDKITKTPDFAQLNENNLKELEHKTAKCFIEEKNKIFDSYKRKPVVFICSDSDDEKQKFIYNYCQDVIVINIGLNKNTIENTYSDLYMLSKSKLIILSQKHSNFSIFSSLVGNTSLIYFYEDNDMIKNGNFSNYIFYKG